MSKKEDKKTLLALKELINKIRQDDLNNQSCTEITEEYIYYEDVEETVDDTVTYNGLSIPVSAGDYVELEIVNDAVQDTILVGSIIGLMKNDPYGWSYTKVRKWHMLLHPDIGFVDIKKGLFSTTIKINNYSKNITDYKLSVDKYIKSQLINTLKDLKEKLDLKKTMDEIEKRRQNLEKLVKHLSEND